MQKRLSGRSRNRVLRRTGRRQSSGAGTPSGLRAVTSIELTFGTLNCAACCLARVTALVPIPPVEYRMSKRKPATASKHARSPKIRREAQRATQATVRSPKVGLRTSCSRLADASPSRNDSKTSDFPCYRESSDSPTRRFQKDDYGYQL